MKKRTTILLFIASTWLLSFAIQAVDYVHLSEILYDTPLNEQIVSPPYSNGEYVELYNAGSEPANLTGWQLLGDGATEQYTFGSVTLPPQSFLIIAYRHARSPEFLLSTLFPGVDEGQVLYQDAIALKNTKDYIRLYDAAGTLRDSIYYGNETTIQPPSDRLIAENADGTAGGACLSVQRVRVQFRPDGSTLADHWHWEVAEATPLALSTAYEQPLSPQQRVAFAYDEAGNRTSRTIVLATNSRRSARRAAPQDTPDPFTELTPQGRTVRIYPNPTQGWLQAEVIGLADGDRAVWRLYSLQGTLLLQAEAAAGVPTDLDLSALPAGTYVLHLSVDGTTTEYKVIKR